MVLDSIRIVLNARKMSRDQTEIVSEITRRMRVTLELEETVTVRASQRSLDSFDLERFKELKSYAYTKEGLDLSQEAAIAWAEKNVSSRVFDLDRFKELQSYAYIKEGLDLSREVAISWAEKNVLNSGFELQRFKELKSYA